MRINQCEIFVHESASLYLIFLCTSDIICNLWCVNLDTVLSSQRRILTLTHVQSVAEGMWLQYFFSCCISRDFRCRYLINIWVMQFIPAIIFFFIEAKKMSRMRSLIKTMLSGKSHTFQCYHVSYQLDREKMWDGKKCTQLHFAFNSSPARIIFFLDVTCRKVVLILRK